MANTESFFHLHMKNITRRRADGTIHSAGAKAAYNSGQNLLLERENRTTTLSKRYDIFYEEVLTPDNAPAWAKNREELWNKVDASAKRKDARLAKEITAALVVGIPPEQWRQLAHDFAQEYLDLGQVVDIAIHEDGSLHNPHIHFLMTVNHLGTDNFKKKIAEVDQKRYLISARRRWEALTNEYLEANGLELRVDARSYKARGLSQQPTRHRGPNRAERNAWKQRAQLNNQNRQENVMSYSEDDPRAWVENVKRESFVDRTQLYSEQWDTALEVMEQVRHEPASPQEEVLRAAVKDAPEALKYEIEKEILHQKALRLAEKEQTARLNYIEEKLDADGLREFQKYMETQERTPDYPQPERGPDNDLRSPVELADARKRMLQDYERDPNLR